MKVLICDACGQHWPRLRAKLKRGEGSWGDSWWRHFDLCDDCWQAFKAFVTAKKEPPGGR